MVEAAKGHMVKISLGSLALFADWTHASLTTSGMESSSWNHANIGTQLRNFASFIHMRMSFGLGCVLAGDTAPVLIYVSSFIDGDVG